jgi:thiosulfate/3-mercaptopyruvate sulfurtransferase
MPFTTILSVDQLFAHRTAKWVIVDCRFKLTDSEYGRKAHAEGHIGGAHYAHLDQDLSGPIVPGVTGRHPTPGPDEFRTRVGSWGIGPETQVVAYDDGPGALGARLWWLLRYYGHSKVAVLDGGWAGWTRAGHASSTSGAHVPAVAPYPVRKPLVATANAAELAAAIAASLSDPVLVDARAIERYRGDEEPLDAVAGHIPGATSRPFAKNIGPDGRFLSPADLRGRFERLGRATDQVHYCGSGVTAAHNLLAMEIGGLSGARLYPGSWSEWITEPLRPVALGD